MKASCSPPIGQLIAEMCRAHHARASAVFGQLGLHRGQPGILKLLWEADGRTHSEFAAALHVQPATITNILNRMEEAGLVERRSDPDDRRVWRVFLTLAGREVESKVREALGRLDEEVVQGFSPVERTDLEGYLLRVRDNLWTARGEADS